MEALDKALDRERLRAESEAAAPKPAVVKSLSDIKRVLVELDPHRNPPQLDVPVSTQLNVQDDDKKVVYSVKTNTRSKSRRDMLVEGLNIVKNRVELVDKLSHGGEPVEVNGIAMKPAVLGSGVNGMTWVDPLIKFWMGGHRDGLLICWDFGDGYVYKYDLFEHKLTRTEK